jgi:hypothetical protein
MLRLIRRSATLALLAVACIPPASLTADEHEELARSYERTADSIEHECWKARRNELTVVDPEMCWKAKDKRFLDANRNAAAYHFAEARRLRRELGEPEITASR